MKTIDLDKSHPQAVHEYLLGEDYCVSSFEDFITYGYGELSQYGFWEFPLIFKEDESETVQ